MLRRTLQLSGFLMILAPALTLAISVNGQPACFSAAETILSQYTTTVRLEKAWPFAAANFEGLSSNALNLNPHSEFSAFVLKATGGKAPKNILIDAHSAWPAEAVATENLGIVLERWGLANKDKFLKLAQLFQADPRDLISAYFKQSGANLDQFYAALTTHGALIPNIVEHLNATNFYRKDLEGLNPNTLSVSKFAEKFLQNPAYLKTEFSLPEMDANLYEIQRAVNNMNISEDEFTRRLSQRKISYAQFKQYFWAERNRADQPGKFKTIMQGLESRFKELRRVTKFEALRDSPEEFKEFTRRVLQDGAEKTLTWMKNLQPAQVANIFRSMKRDIAQKFVTSPDLVKTAVSLTIFDTLIFGGTQLAKYGKLDGEFGWTLFSIIASEIPLTLASVDKMAYLAAKEFPGERTLAESSLRNVPLSLNNLGPKSWKFVKDWGSDVRKDVPMLFTYSTIMTLATQLAAQATGWRKNDSIDVLGSTLEISIWFALIANVRYKFWIPRVQVPLSRTSYFLAHPRANMAMIQGITAVNMATGNLLWVYEYSPWFHSFWNRTFDGGKGATPASPAANTSSGATTPPNPSGSDLETPSEAVQAAQALDEYEDIVRAQNPPPPAVGQ